MKFSDNRKFKMLNLSTVNTEEKLMQQRLNWQTFALELLTVGQCVSWTASVPLYIYEPVVEL